jgi:photosystem II stability/assembly factor-like uncharacterized protein
MNRTPAAHPLALLRFCLLILGLVAGCLRPAVAAPLDPRLIDAFTARSIGPANMGGRITAVAVVESKPAIQYVGAASGGVWKTTNNGTTWTPILDRAASAAIGDVAVAPSNPDVVWVGTGEANARNSVSWGDGVYRSTDAGRTWTHVGLADTRHIGRIAVHPRDPNTAYVAALGHLWGPNSERGLFKTTDGGRTWRQVKAIDPDTGMIDVALDPANPETVYAAAYQVRRDAFSGPNPAVQCGSSAGLYRSEDGGESWERLSGGLPHRPLGRCGIDVYRKDPRIVYAVVQTDRTPTSVTGQTPRRGGPIDVGGVFRSEDRGRSWTKVNDLCPRPFYYGQIRIDPNDDRRIYVLGLALYVSHDGGRTFTDHGAPGVHADHHALWIDPHDSDHLVLGSDGGLSYSYDRGTAWEHLHNLPIGQFYGVAVDLRKPYRVYGGLQDNGSWGGPSATHNLDGITTADWYRVLGADGFQCQVDPGDPATVYAEGQYGMLRRVNIRSGETLEIRPIPPKGVPAYRFNWNAPVLLSPHNPRTVYYGGNYLFRSVDRGDHWQVISPDLTHGKPGPSASTGHTITAIAESPLQPGLLYVGTDDGRLHVHRSGGATWTELSDRILGLPPERWISRIECSPFDVGTAYVTIDRHRNDDFAPYVFRTRDHGATWEPLANDLPPTGPVHVVRASSRQKGLLFAGTELGLFVSPDDGGHWQRLHRGLPTVPVHDLVIHPRDRDLVIATHGRSLYVLDIGPLEELTSEVMGTDAYLFEVKPATAFTYHGSHGAWGQKRFVGSNPPYGATIAYYLRAQVERPPVVTITDAVGNRVAEFTGGREPGIHRVSWDLRLAVGIGPLRFGTLVPAGDYVARLQVSGQVLKQKIRVEAAE